MGGNQSQAINYNENLQNLQNIEKIIFDLNEKNINESVESSLSNFPKESAYSFIFIVCRIVYSFFVSKGLEKLCFEYLQTFERKLKENSNISFNKVIDVFAQLLLSINNQETKYLLERMVENKMIDQKICTKKKHQYFAHYIGREGNGNMFDYEQIYQDFIKNYEELSKNDWELHKKLIKEGVNPNEIAKIIRNDEIEKLQEISSQNNFDFNQTIEPSLYERRSFINKENVSLIDYAAFFGSIKCFKYLIMNNVNVENTGKYAVAGGNEEIIHHLKVHMKQQLNSIEMISLNIFMIIKLLKLMTSKN